MAFSPRAGIASGVCRECDTLRDKGGICACSNAGTYGVDQEGLTNYLKGNRPEVAQIVDDLHAGKIDHEEANRRAGVKGLFAPKNPKN